MKRKIALLLWSIVLLQGFHPLLAQNLLVSGTVTSSVTRLPLSGATVTVKGTSNGVATDANGNFSISVPKTGSILEISYVGMAAMEVAVKDGSPLAITMSELPGSLNELVVTGYGQQRRTQVTGAISSIKADQLKSVSSTRIEQALQGRTAGVQVVPISGQPGSGMSVRIRGTGSNRNSNPLVIIDGVRAGGLESIDPSEVASIDILKDAASAAIYGAEGANGVLIVTTKTGRRNSSQITYSGQYGTQSVKDGFVKMMNAQQYQQYLQEAGVAGRPTPADVANIGEGTDWMKETTQTAPQQHHSMTFSGGSEKSTYLLAGNIFTQDGIVGGDKARFNRYTFRFNTDNQVKSWLNLGNRFVYSHHRRKAISENNEFGSILGTALVMDPITPVIYNGNTNLPSHVQTAINNGKPLRVDANGNIYGISQFLKGEYGNPLARIDMAHGENVQNKIVGSVYAEILPFTGFKFTSKFGLDGAFQTGHGWTPTFWFSDESQNTIANGYDYSNNWFTWQVENFATYQFQKGEHNFEILGGISAQKTTETHMGGSYSGLFKEEEKFSYADFVPDAQDRIGSISFKRTLASFYGRLSYDYQNKYLLRATLRRDGSSLFSPDYQWGTFPSVSLGWVFTNENFMSSANWLNYGKLRVSWGQNGSLSSVGLGEWLNSIGANLIYPDSSGGLLVGAAPTSLAYPQLTWETSEQFNIGADFAFFNNRLNLTVDYFKKTTQDLLTAGNAPLFAGNILKSVNAGTVENKGIEIELGYQSPAPRNNGFSYGISVNYTHIKNNVTYLDPNSPILFGAGIGTGWSATAMQVGNPIWYFNGYKTAGIFQNQAEIDAYIAKTGITGYSPKPGEPIVVDANNDKAISSADMTNIGSPHPDHMFGARLNLGWKSFDFLIFAQGQQGNEVLMGFNRGDRSTANKPEFFYNNRWTGEGSTNTWFASNTGNPYIYNGDLMVFDGSYVRIRQLQLGYTLPRNISDKMKVSNARIYFSLDDFFTFTKYPGVDPEGGNNGGNSIGIDRGGYPIPRKALAGISITF
jgi:TonB-dependent starch-binding outer membrane protein SusC